MMAQTKQITKTKFLEMFSRKSIEDPVGPVTVGTEKRFYGRTTEEAANDPNGYFVVYFVD